MLWGRGTAQPQLRYVRPGQKTDSEVHEVVPQQSLILYETSHKEGEGKPIVQNEVVITFNMHLISFDVFTLNGVDHHAFL